MKSAHGAGFLYALATELGITTPDIMIGSSGKTRYVSAADSIDPFEILRASKAIPILFRKRILFSHHRYIDGELGPVLQDHVAHVLAQDARNIVIINNFGPWARANSLIVRLWAHLTPLGLHDAVIRDITTDIKLFHAPNARVLFLSPQNLPCGTATRNKAKIRATLARGVANALALQDELSVLLK